MVSPIISGKVTTATPKESAASGCGGHPALRRRLVRCISAPLFILLLIASLAGGNIVAAQQAETTVPDLTGLTTPQAARAVGLAKLMFGTETTQAWTADASVKANQVSAQEPAAGSKVAPGSAVNVTVLRVFNAALAVDANSLSLFNLSDAPLDLTGVVFRSGDGSRQFNAPDWSRALPAKKCNQLWVSASARTKIPDCDPANRAIIVAKNRQFWVGNDFSIERNGDVIATCAAGQSRCEIALPQGDDPERTSYLAFSYRINHLEVRNDSERWMSLSGAQIVGNNGQRFDLQFQLDGTTPGDVPWAGSRLAPGQCLVLSELDVPSLPPFDCTVVAYARLKEKTSFWTRGFGVTGPTGRRTACAAPTPGLQSLCLVPR
jgi:hypothetical protein